LRNADALRELRLNRRLGPDVYLGVAPVEPAGAGWRVAELGETAARDLEHALVMRRLPDGRDGLSLLAAGALGPAQLRAAADCIAVFHRAHALGVPAPFSSEEWRERIDRPMQDLLTILREHALVAGLGESAVEALAEAWKRALALCLASLEARRASGCAVDGHGDLHLAHLWFESGRAEPLFVDCVEFDGELRRIDAAADVAFLFMDLVYRGQAPLAERWLSAYAEASGDYGLYDVVDLYAAYRAAVRAMVAALAAGDREIDGAQRSAAAKSAARHLALATRLLMPKPAGTLVLVAGTVGVGKSTVALALAEAAAAVLLSSDRTRKALAGLRPEARAGTAPDAGLYAPDWNERTYAALLARSAPALRSGRAVVLDATWSARSRRADARARAAELGSPAWLVQVDCAESVAWERVRSRALRGDDPSDAGPELVAASRARFEPLDDWPSAERVDLRSDGPLRPEQIAAMLARMGLAMGSPQGS
jgi:hypothetical protein